MKLYTILQSFDKIELNRVEKYINSPYFNKNKALIQLFELLVKHLESKKEGELNREKVWKKIMGAEVYDDVRYRKLNSDLLKLVEGYLAQQVYDENPLHQATYLIEAVGKRKLDKLYNTTMKAARRLSEQQFFRPASYYLSQYQIERNYYELTEAEMKREDKSNVEEIINNLDKFYLAEKLRYYCSLLSRQYVVSHEYQLLFIDEIIEHIKIYKYENVTPISIYYQIYLTQTNTTNEEYYYKLKELLNKYALTFPIDEANALYVYAINYCVRQINKGNQKYLAEYFELYKELLQKEIIFIDEKLTPLSFKNIILAALRLEKYEWAENFIEKYQSKLSEEFRENAVTYNLALVYFYQKKHDKVLALLNQVEYEDITYNLGAKNMLIATYYEIDEIEPLYSLLESFRVFLNRHKNIPEQRRNNYLNLIKYTKKLTQLIPNDKKGLHKLKEDLEKEKGVASVDWLKEKIAELEKR
ncbi:MAG: hypothetical protein RLZZ292_516 [Bacteroidota bacterium]|jgi:hypothetical protein